MLCALAALFGWSFLAAAVLPLGSEAPLAVYVRSYGQVAVPVLVATAGNYLGACTTYWLGRRAARALGRGPVASAVDGSRGGRLLRRFGAPSPLLSWVPILGDALVALAGAARVPFGSFSVWTALGKGVRRLVRGPARPRCIVRPAPTAATRGEERQTMTVRERATGRHKNKTPRRYYDFMINGVRYKGATPGTRTKNDAERVETQKRLEVYEGRCISTARVGFSEFINQTYLPWANDNKRSWYDDELIARVLCEFFGDRAFNQITPMLIEKFKKGLRETPTKHGAEGRPATVNRALAVLSRTFSLAVDAGATDANPRARVRKLRTGDARIRYLLPEEEARLTAALEGNGLLRDVVTLATHTGMRRGEILKLRWSDADIARGGGVIHVRQTKTGKDREVR